MDPELVPISCSIRGMIQTSPLVHRMVAPMINRVRLIFGLQLAGSFVRATNMMVMRKHSCLVAESLAARTWLDETEIRVA